MTTFVDYAWWQVSPAQLTAMGFSGAMRYGTPHNTKSATAPEVANLRAAGFDVGLVFESTANRSAQGSAAGHDDAVAANAFATSLGYPPTCTLWYAVDFDAQPGQVQPYFDGIASAGGRTYAPYGSADVIDGVRYPGIGWQTAAWSRGRVSKRAGLLQNGFHDTYDSNAVLVADFGQWRAGVVPAPVVPVPLPALEAAMFSAPPDGEPHDFPVTSWAKRVVPVSTGARAKIALGDGMNNWLVLAPPDKRDKDDFAFWGNNQSWAAAIPNDRRATVQVINFGPSEVNLTFDVA